MRNLALISLLTFITACSPSPYLHLKKAEGVKSCLDKLKPGFSSVLYNAQVNVTGKHLSGLLLFKEMPDSSTRVLFTNEMGVTFFDFEFAPKGFQAISIVKQMNKNVVINRLKSDIGLLLHYGFTANKAENYNSGRELYHVFKSGKDRVYYISDPICSQMLRIETASKKKKKIIVNLTGDGSGMPDSVYLAHQSFEYNITLKKIHR
jgi:hypothetical protein